MFDVELVLGLRDDTPPHGVLNAPGAWYADFPVHTTCGVVTYQVFFQGNMMVTVETACRQRRPSPRWMFDIVEDASQDVMMLAYR